MSLTGSISPAWADGVDEAARGLWPSAAESFAAARADHPADPRPPLAEALCRLRMGDAAGAAILLEGSPALRAPDLEPHWRDFSAWLRAAARLKLGDPAEALAAASRLPAALQRRVEAHGLIAEGRRVDGLLALLREATAQINEGQERR